MKKYPSKIFIEQTKRSLLVVSVCTFWITPTLFANVHTSNARNLPGVTSLTADEQAKGTNADIETTRIVRQELMDDTTLSTEAKNITVVTLDNTITLKGSISSEAERAKVAEKVQSVAGQYRVNNEITVRTR